MNPETRTLEFHLEHLVQVLGLLALSLVKVIGIWSTLMLVSGRVRAGLGPPVFSLDEVDPPA